jgi:hypothetical protein
VLKRQREVSRTCVRRAVTELQLPLVARSLYHIASRSLWQNEVHSTKWLSEAKPPGSKPYLSTRSPIGDQASTSSIALATEDKLPRYRARSFRERESAGRRCIEGGAVDPSNPTPRPKEPVRILSPRSSSRSTVNTLPCPSPAEYTSIVPPRASVTRLTIAKPRPAPVLRRE